MKPRISSTILGHEIKGCIGCWIYFIRVYSHSDAIQGNRNVDNEKQPNVVLDRVVSYGLLAPIQRPITNITLSRRGSECYQSHFSPQPRRTPPLSYCSARLADNLGCMTGGSS